MKILFLLLLVLPLFFFFAEIEYAYLPPPHKIVPYEPQTSLPAFDRWGESISKEKTEEMKMTEEGKLALSPENGAIRIDAALLKKGRKAFYEDAAGTELPWKFSELSKAVLDLKGKGTSNLMGTGLDVAAGSWFPLGIQARYKRGCVQMRMTCAACHATVDTTHSRILEGVPNRNFILQDPHVQTPDTFTYQEHPYGWTGYSGLGPFKGLSAISHFPHDFSGFQGDEKSHAIAAWLNTLRPPPSQFKAGPEKFHEGRTVFEKANCVACHDGEGLTNNRVIPLDQIRTDPRHAQLKMKKPLAEFLKTSPEIPVSTDQLNQTKMAWAENGKGGYKVPGLWGLRLTAPYLHDGSVPDLPSLFDRNLRQKKSGHEFWVDKKAGYSNEEKAALIAYLLSL